MSNFENELRGQAETEAQQKRDQDALNLEKEQQNRQDDQLGRENIASFIQLMNDHGIQPVPLPSITYHAYVKSWWSGSKEVKKTYTYSQRGWAAEIIDTDYHDRIYIAHYILEDGSVTYVGERPYSLDQPPLYSPPRVFKEARGLAFQARCIIRTRNARYCQRPTSPHG